MNFLFVNIGFLMANFLLLIIVILKMYELSGDRLRLIGAREDYKSSEKTYMDAIREFNYVIERRPDCVCAMQK